MARRQPVARLASGRVLRPWQEKALGRWVGEDCHGIAEVVTGGGKTVFALAATDHWLGGHPQATTCILVPTTALQDQWAVALAEDFGVSESDLCLWPEERRLDRPFHVMVVNTARRIMPQIAQQRDQVLLIADECHRYASPENRLALVRTSASLGLSATAKREHDAGYEEVLVPILGRTIYEYGLEEARRDGVISPFRLNNVEIPLGDDEEEEYRRLGIRLARAMSGGDDELIKRIAMMRASVSKRARMRVPVAAAILDQHRGVRALVFHESIESAEAIVNLITARGHSAAAYHTGIGPALRRDNLRQFKRGWIDVLVSCRALDEGIDVPEAEMALIAASTASQRQRIQRLGRVLRPASGKDAALVVTLFATTHEQARLLREQEALTDVVEVTWQRAGVGDA